jgi:hypothetical protein
LALLILAFSTPGIALALAGDQLGLSRRNVWFAPDNDTADFLDLFSKPDLWAASRSRIGVFKFGPQQIKTNGQPAINSVDQLIKLDAFQKLRLADCSLESSKSPLCSDEGARLKRAPHDLFARPGASETVAALVDDSTPGLWNHPVTNEFRLRR